MHPMFSSIQRGLVLVEWEEIAKASVVARRNVLRGLL